MTYILTIKQLTKRFDGVCAIDGLSVSFERGIITGIIGPNGSGKSTLVNVLTGVLSIDGGSIVVGKTEVVRLVSHKIAAFGVTRTFQEVRLFEQMSVLDNLLVVLSKRPVWRALFEWRHSDYERQAKILLERVRLWEKRDALAHDLSYGQRKLLEVARVLAMDTDIILLDEPFAGLFPEMVKIIVAVIRELKAQGKTIVLIEHNIEIIKELADELVVMDAGTLLSQGEVESVLKQRAVIEAYLGD